jgi:short-subunit dehydrogenase
MTRAMKKLSLGGKYTLITGASSGLGAAMARSLVVKRRARVLLAARRVDRLEAIARELDPSGTRVAFIQADLATDEGTDRMLDAALARDVHAAVLAAGSYWFGEFTAMTPEVIDTLLAVDVRAPVRCARKLLPHFDARGGGGLLFVASTGSFMPTPRQAVYGGAKSFLQNFARSLHFERGGTSNPVHVTLACPGGMPTEMLEGSPVREVLARNKVVSAMMMQPEAVAEASLDAWVRGEAEVVPGVMNRAMVAFSRVLPLGRLGEGAARVYDPKK